jgi:hypothetical protein
MTLFRPNPPVVGKVTHHTIELDWSHNKKDLDPMYLKDIRFKVQELSPSQNKNEWNTIYK